MILKPRPPRGQVRSWRLCDCSLPPDKFKAMVCGDTERISVTWGAFTWGEFRYQRRTPCFDWTNWREQHADYT